MKSAIMQKTPLIESKLLMKLSLVYIVFEFKYVYNNDWKRGSNIPNSVSHIRKLIIKVNDILYLL